MSDLQQYPCTTPLVQQYPCTTPLVHEIAINNYHLYCGLFNAFLIQKQCGRKLSEIKFFQALSLIKQLIR